MMRFRKYDFLDPKWNTCQELLDPARKAHGLLWFRELESAVGVVVLVFFKVSYVLNP